MARKHQGTDGLKSLGAGILTALLAVTIAWAQDTAPGQRSETQIAPVSPPVMPAPFSRDCQIGSTAIVEESPLPNVSAALQNRKKVKILAIGAASAGRRRGGHTEEIRQILLKAVKGLDVVMINRGVSGELAAQAAERIKNEVALEEPDLVLWQIGTNDALAYVPIAQLEETVIDTIRWLKEHKVDVVLVGLQYVDRMEQDAHYKAVREMLRKVAAKENVMIVRRYEAQRLLAQAEGSGGGLVPDEFERSESGYVCLAQYMARAITIGLFGHKLMHRSPAQEQAQPRN
jgi:lysophospholipase L1-like esterase